MKGRFSYISDNIHIARQAVSGSRLRSSLTVTIVALGITCLVGSQTAIDCLGSLLAATFGTNAERVTFSSLRSSQKEAAPLTCAQAAEFAVRHTGACAVTAYLPLTTAASYAQGRFAPQTTVMAASGDWLTASGLEIGEGRTPHSGECLLGKSAASTLEKKSGRSAVGQTVSIGGRAFAVAGIATKQSSLLGALADNTIYIPLATAVPAMMPESSACAIELTLPAGKDSENVLRQAEALLRRIRHVPDGEKTDFEIVEGSAAVREIENLGGSLSMIALLIGLLTLCGAAVALANIMLVCVAERTREVGLRRAVGGRARDIRASFITEAVLICEAGCIIGTLAGILCGNAVSALARTRFSIPWDWILLSQGISIAVGVAACALPSKRAASLNVVDALRCS